MDIKNMTAVILAGGKGTRISEESALRPKPLVTIGGKPILWHIMKIYGSFGVHKFIICCGYKGEAIKEYFLNFNLENGDTEFLLGEGKIQTKAQAKEDWDVILVNTGLNTKTAGRVRQIKKYIGEDDEFFLTYGDGVADIDLNSLLDLHHRAGKIVTISTTQPEGRFGAIKISDDGIVESFSEKARRNQSFVNIGFMVMTGKVWGYLGDGFEMLENGPFEALASDRQMTAYRHPGFWSPMDNMNDRAYLEKQWAEGAPWKIWESKMSIRKEDFADSISQRIFQWREALYKTGNYNYIIEMICQEQNEYIKKINSHSLEILNKIKTFKGKIVIYGMGHHAHILKNFLFEMGFGEKLFGFCNSSNLCSDEVEMEGLPCIWVDELKESEDFLVLIPDGQYAFEMKRHLENDLHMNDSFICLVPFAVIDNGIMEERSDLQDIFLNENNHFIVYGDDWNAYLFRWLFKQANKHADFVISDKSILTDNFSLFRERNDYYLVVYSIKRKSELLRNDVPAEKIIHLANIDALQYFDSEIVPRHIIGKREVFVDGGSMNLYTAESFINWCNGEVDCIYAFEPDKRCIDICEKKLRKDTYLDNSVNLIKKGLWSRETELSFKLDDNVGSSKIKEKSQDNKIEVTSIDECVKNIPVTFIKMDIEGAELEALKGAKNTIIQNKPILAISLYHKPQDIVELPSYIKELVPEYKLYIRNYHQDPSECVLYAMIDEKR